MSSSASPETLFALLPRTRTPWAEFVFSSAMQALIIAGLACLPLVTPVVEPVEHSFHAIVLVNTPVAVNHQPQPLLLRMQPASIIDLDPPADALRLPAPLAKVAGMHEEDAPAPVVRITAKKMEAVANSAPVIPKPGVKVNVFSTGSSAVPTLARAPAQVQTGGFGDPNGVPAKTGQGRIVNVAALGSFDLPPGPGYGNGTGGAKGVAGVVVSSGFGNSTAITENRPRVPRTVQASGFVSTEVPAPATLHAHPAEAVRLVPAEIISKPTPAYTPEARHLRIEGEVLLEVVLQASGNLRVVRVVRGLGHGLDDNAVKAAQQIHFKPALRDGQPADSTVVLHIIFQLA
jgi:TonB family protein